MKSYRGLILERFFCCLVEEFFMASLNRLRRCFMASEAILEKKQAVIDEIKNRTENAKTIVLFDYRGITDSEAKELRIKLRNVGADYKVYK
ncbi:MAG: 50S ribosomal protein L10, partial [Bacilli bacterium]|nr:50S ribosomal protein L10 [Bacilli bacterium]